ncbi:MAG: OmpA family protein [Candidatus Hydrothermales bacterium]
MNVIKLFLIFYPLYFTPGENFFPTYPFASQNIYFNPALIGSEFNPNYTLSLLSTNLALTNNGLSISLYNDIMSAHGDSITKPLKENFFKNIGSSWKINHLSYFSPFSFSLGRFALGLRAIQASVLILPEPWLRILLYGNELDKTYIANKDNTALQVLNLIEARAGFGHGIFIDKEEKYRLLYGLNFAFYISGPYIELNDVNVRLNSYYDGITGDDFIKIRVDTTFPNFGYSIDLGFGLEYKKNLNFTLGLSNIISNINFSKGLTYIHHGNLDTLYLGEGIDFDTLYTDKLDTIPAAFSVKLPLIFKFSTFYRHPEEKYKLFLMWEQGFKNTAFSTKSPRISLGGEYFAHPRIPLRLGLIFGGYEGISLSLGTGIISRDFSSINIGISQHRGILLGSRGLSISFLTEFHSTFKGKFRYKIIDSITNRPIANAIFKLTDRNNKKVFEGQSDVNGEIKGEIKKGEYKFEVEAENYYSKSGVLEIRQEVEKEGKILLKTKFGYLTLYVKDRETNIPLKNVDVTIQYREKTINTKTDSLGTLRLKLERGDYKFRFEHPEYILRTESYTIESGVQKEAEILLAPRFGTVMGKIYNAQTFEPLVGYLEIYPEDVDSLIEKLETYEDGNYNVRLFEGIYKFKVKVSNYIPQEAYIRVVGGKEIVKDFAMLKEKMVFTFRNIYFDFNKATIRPESYPVLDSIALMLKENPTIIVEIGGHTDERGSKSYNKNLSQKRSESVRNYLFEKHGIELLRLIPVGYGEDFPVVKNAKTEEEHQLNRRVEFKILGEKR